MENLIRKQVGKLKEQRPLERLKRINKLLKKLGCSFKSNEYSTIYRKVVGHKLKK